MRAIDFFKTSFNKGVNLPSNFKITFFNIAVTLVLFISIGVTSFGVIYTRDLSSRAAQETDCQTTPGNTIIKKPDPQLQKQVVENLNEKQKEVNKTYADAKNSISFLRDQKKIDLKQLIKERNGLLTEAIKFDPDTAARNLLTDEQKNEAKVLAQNCVEETKEVTGELRVLYADYIDDKSPNKINGLTAYRLQTDKNEMFYLHPTKEVDLDSLGGQKIKVKGVGFDDDILVSNTPGSVLSAENSNVKAAVSNPIIPGNTGQQNMVIAMVYWADRGHPNTTKATVDNEFNIAANYFWEASYNKMSLVGFSIDWTLIPENHLCSAYPNTDEYWPIRDKVINKIDPLVNFSVYNRLVIISDFGCWWGGLGASWASATTGEGVVTLSTALLQEPGWPINGVLRHEFSHSLGGGHSNLLNCGSVSLAEGCPRDSSSYDTLGGADAHLAAPTKEIFGWFSSTNVREVTSGTYTIEPFETATSGLKAIKIPRKQRGSYQDYMYIEYRQPIGWDANLSTNYPGTDVFNGALIHVLQTHYTMADVVDTSPPTAITAPALTPGRTLVDPVNNYQIRVDSATSSGLTVTVIPPKGYILGRIFRDDNGNGIHDPSEIFIQEPGTSCTNSTSIAGFNVEVTQGAFDKFYKATNCNSDAYYISDPLDLGSYQIFINKPAGWTSTGVFQSNDDPVWTVSSDKILVSGNLTAGLYKDIWFGIKPPMITLSGRVTNASTGQGISNVVINQGSNPCGSLSGTFQTDANGNFTIANVPKYAAFCLRAPTLSGYTGPDATNSRPMAGESRTSYECQTAGLYQNPDTCGGDRDLTADNTYNFTYTPLDTTAPTVSLTAPTNGSFVSGIAVAVNATASDNTGGSGVARVDYYLDGSTTPSGTDSTAPYSWAWNTTSTTNGSHTVSAKAIDNAGNTSTAATVTVTVDNAAPTVSITAPVANAKLKGTTSITATASDNTGGSGMSKVEFLVNGVIKCTDTTFPYSCSWNTTTTTDGIHSLTAKAYDNKNNLATSTAVLVTVDNTAPTLLITAPTNGATVSGSAVNITATATDVTLSVTKVEFAIDSSLYCTDTTSTYACSWNSTLYSDGSHTITTTAYDTTGNTASVSITVTVSNDTTAPMVSITAPSSGSYLSGTTPITATASDSVGVTKVEFYSGTIKLGEDLNSPYSYSWNTATTTNGSKNLTAKAYDAAGHVGTSVAVSVTVDNSAPTVSITAPAASSYLKGTVTFSAIASDNNSITQVQFLVDGGVVSTDTTSPYSYSWNTTTASNAAHILTTKASDQAGNITTSSGISVTVDNSVPTVSVTSPTNGSTVSAVVSVIATASDNTGVTNVEFLVDGVVKGSDASNPYSYSWDTNTYANGAHSLTANAYDQAGNATTSVTVNLTVSNTVPDTQVPTTPTNLIATAVSSSQVNLNWTASTDNVGVVGYNILRNGVEINTSATTSFGDGTVSANTPYSYSVSAYDAAGNTSAVSVPVSVTTPAPSDITAPTVSVTAPANNATVSGTINITASASDNVGVTKVEFNINGDLVSTDTTSPYSYSWNTTSFPNATYQISAKAFDAANNSTTSSIITVTVSNENASADINGDTKINVLDLSILLSKWGTANTSGDLNRDSTVDIIDLSILLSNWSP